MKKYKIISLFIVIAIALQMTTSFTNIVFANEKTAVTVQDIKDGIEPGDTISASVEGVPDVIQVEIPLGDITPVVYEGYQFINATVDDVIVNCIGKYNNEYYYSTKATGGAYLLGTNKLVLHYQKDIKTFNITYQYPNDIFNVIGDQTIQENKRSSFRIETLDNKYRIKTITLLDKVLVADQNGYYTIENITSDITVKIVSELIENYNITLDKRFISDIPMVFEKQIERKKPEWSLIATGQSINKTVNSIVVNNQYINISTNDTAITSFPDGSMFKVISQDNGRKHSYEIYGQNIQSDLHFVPSTYVNPSIALTKVEGALIYHWNGKSLEAMPKGAMIPKNNSTDIFFVDTQPGYEASVGIGGNGSSVIEKINTVDNVANVEGGYTAAKNAALAIGCDYTFFYSSQAVGHREIEMATSLINYTIEYDLKGGIANPKIEDNNTYSILPGNNIVTVSNQIPTKDGYTFNGWKLVDTDTIYYANNEIVIDKALFDKLSTGSLLFEAQWVPIKDIKTSFYTVKHFFEQTDGTYVENESKRTKILNAPVGHTAIALPLENIPNYTHNSKKQYLPLSGTVAIGGTLELGVYYRLNEATVTYDDTNVASGKAPVDSNSPYKAGLPIKVLDNTGHLVGNYEDNKNNTFICWSTNKDKTDNYYYPGDIIEAKTDIVFYPVFVGDLKNANTLRFVAGANGSIDGQVEFTVPSGVTFKKAITSIKSLPVASPNKAYLFAGWYVNDTKIASTNEELFNVVKNLDTSSIMEARFIENSDLRHDISYTVNYYLGDTLEDAKKGEIQQRQVIVDKDVTQATTSLIVRNLDTSDYYFEGYILGAIDPIDIKNGDSIEDQSIINIYYVKDVSRWTKVTFLAGEHGVLDESQETVITNDVLIGKTMLSQEIIIPTITPKNDWLVSKNKWDLEINKETLVTKDLVITAQYEEDRNKDTIPDKDQYVTIIFNAGEFGDFNGETSITIEKLLPGDRVITPTLTIRDGYTFTGYDYPVITTIETDTAKELIYTATYTVTPVVPITPVVPGDTPTITPTDNPIIPVVARAGITPPVPFVPTPIIGPEENTVIEDVETPTVNTDTTIEDRDIPLAKSIGGQWALFNLLSVLVTIVLGVFILLSKNKSSTTKVKTTRIIKISSGIISLVSIITFALTQNILASMITFDTWSIVMAAFVIIQLVVLLLVKNNKKSQKEIVQEA